MKIPRAALKAVVKECLLEILAEGLSSKKNQQVQDVRTRQDVEQPRVKQEIVQPLKQAITEVVSTSNIPGLDQILLDTAKTSFPEQVNAAAPLEKNKQVLAAAKSSNPEAGLPLEVFGDVSSWAALAFDTSSNSSKY